MSRLTATESALPADHETNHPTISPVPRRQRPAPARSPARRPAAAGRRAAAPPARRRGRSRGRSRPPAADATATRERACRPPCSQALLWGVQGVFRASTAFSQAFRAIPRPEGTARYELDRQRHDRPMPMVQDHLRPEKGELRPAVPDLLLGRPRPDPARPQGPDTGSQYRSSAVFTTERRAEAAGRAYIAQLDAAKAYRAKIVHMVCRSRRSIRPRPYHQDYLTLNPTQPYIVRFDLRRSPLESFFPPVPRRAGAGLARAGRRPLAGRGAGAAARPSRIPTSVTPSRAWPKSPVAKLGRCA